MVPPVPGTTGPAELTSGERGQGSISSGPLRALAWRFHCAGRTVRPPCCRSVVSEDNISPSWSPREGNHPGCPCCQSCWVLPAAGAVPSRGRGCARAPLQGPDRGAVSPSSGRGWMQRNQICTWTSADVAQLKSSPASLPGEGSSRRSCRDSPAGPCREWRESAGTRLTLNLFKILNRLSSSEKDLSD